MLRFISVCDDPELIAELVHKAHLPALDKMLAAAVENETGPKLQQFVEGNEQLWSAHIALATSPGRTRHNFVLVNPILPEEPLLGTSAGARAAGRERIQRS